MKRTPSASLLYALLAASVFALAACSTPSSSEKEADQPAETTFQTGDGENFKQNSIFNTIDEASLDASKATEIYCSEPYMTEKGQAKMDFIAVNPEHTQIQFGSFYPETGAHDDAMTVLDRRKPENTWNIIATGNPDTLYTLVLDGENAYILDQRLSNAQISEQKENGFPGAIYTLKLGDTRQKFYDQYDHNE